MGLGDWLIASAQVKEANERTGKKVLLGDGKQYFHDQQIFDNNPRMGKPDEDCVWVPNYPGSRPYIKGYKDKHLIFNDAFSPKPGEVFFSEKELGWLEDNVPYYEYIVVEPTVKNKFSHGQNKAWPYWREIAKEPLPFIQMGTEKGLFPHKKTSTFRDAMLILSKASLFVGTDGGLHHAAAALGIPAVVIWTGFTSPKHLGYQNHINIHNGGEPCGYYGGVCQHCLDIAKSIKPETVLKGINEASQRHLVA